ncbi:MAG TPA: dienelactone hydrolase family protein [Xanthobacteraceae bacterium]|jgi:putative phosphoribosyl transferase
MTVSVMPAVREQLIHVPVGTAILAGTLRLPEGSRGVILFAHGSGSGRHSPRNRRVAQLLNEARLATLLIDLLTSDEEAVDARTAHLRFNIELLTQRLIAATDWLARRADTGHLAIGYFGASTGAAAALVAATERSDLVGAVVSRGGRPDLAGPVLPLVQAPTLLIVGGNDIQVIELNRAALAALRCEKRLVIVPGATHLFEEPGALDQVAWLARDWYQGHLARTQHTPVANR